MGMWEVCHGRLGSLACMRCPISYCLHMPRIILLSAVCAQGVWLGHRNFRPRLGAHASHVIQLIDLRWAHITAVPHSFSREQTRHMLTSVRGIMQIIRKKDEV